MDALAERAIALIRKRGTLRDNQIAGELGSDRASVAAALAPYCESGELVRCSVNLVGNGDVNEYRLSAAGPRKADESGMKKPPTPPEQVLAAANAAQPATKPTEEKSTMSTREKILAALRKHGPMTTPQLRKHINYAFLSTICAQMARAGELLRLGGGKRTTVYGLPGQKLPKGDAAAVATAPARAKKAAKKAAKKVQRKTAKKVQKTVSASVRGAAKEEKRFPDGRAAVNSFRAAIASDGAMIFLGAAAGPYELNRGEARALIDFVRTLDHGEAVAQ